MHHTGRVRFTEHPVLRVGGCVANFVLTLKPPGPYSASLRNIDGSVSSVRRSRVTDALVRAGKGGRFAMTRAKGGTIVSAAILVLATVPAVAVEVGGGGSSRKDCLVTLQAAANTPAGNPRHVRCIDGDPACDSDGTVDGVCRFLVSVCANSTTLDSGCTLNGVQSITVQHAEDNGDPRFDADFQALQARITNEIDPPSETSDVCTAPTVVTVPIKGPYGRNNHCGANRKRLKISSRSQVIDGKVVVDNDKSKLYCLPAPDGCAPTELFAGTFDRIQRQVFNQSCALSGCHDSQTKSGNLLLEGTSSYGNLINQPPDNFAANADGWKRVDVVEGVSGSPEASFLFHKITGDLPSESYGQRMPLNKRKLNRTLRKIIQLWIEAGAPQDAWVPGTD